MVDGISSKTTQFSDMVAKLKAAKTATPSASSAEQKLVDLLDLKPEVTARLSSSRKANAYLQVFNAALRWFNGGKNITGIADYIGTLENKSAKSNSRIDIKI